jgi:hypothetical protein
VVTVDQKTSIPDVEGKQLEEVEEGAGEVKTEARTIGLW